MVGLERCAISYMALGAEATETFDMSARSDIIHDMLEIFTEEVPWYGMCEWPVVTVYNSSMQNVTLTLAGTASLSGILVRFLNGRSIASQLIEV